MCRLDKKIPLNEWKIPLYKIYTDDEDINLITKIVKRGTNQAIGPEIEEFEHTIKNYLGIDYCAVLNAGAPALDSVLIFKNFLGLFFIAILPANIKASMENINYQTGELDGIGLEYLWFRIPLQLFFIVWVFFTAIKRIEPDSQKNAL